MVRSKRSYEGEILIDHRYSPGIPDAMVRQANLPVGAGKGVFEAPCFTCSHCPQVVVMNPMRTRERSYCIKCDHYLCDRCGAIMKVSKECKTYKQILEEIQEQAFREEQNTGVIQHG